MSEKISPQHLERAGILYVRQSTMHQVLHGVESQRLQYAMRDRMCGLGWSDVEVIDEDLGRTASGSARRSGFERLVAQVCLGRVGAVAARDASRFARNNQEWHQLVEMCALVNTLLVDHESVFDPRSSNDRLLLGLKGSLSVYELDQLRHRALAARRAKAQRGELLTTLPAGFVKTEDGRMEKDPDKRVQSAIEMVFRKSLELGAARQAATWFIEHGLDVPVRYNDGIQWRTVWRQPSPVMVAKMLRNPIYSGSYAYGRRHVVTVVEDGLPRKVTRCRPPGEYEVLIHDHHEGYISREDFERIQTMLTKNMQRPGGMSGAAKPGKGLLVGLLRCGRCGRKLHVNYGGKPVQVRYRCDRRRAKTGDSNCIAFGGASVDEALAQELLRVLEPAAIEAAAVAVEEQDQRQSDWVEALKLELDAARYEARRAQRQYESVEPDNRLVAGELESRWNRALEKVEQLERRIEDEDPAQQGTDTTLDRATILTLAGDLTRAWNDSRIDIQLKKRIARALIEEIIVDLPDTGAEITLVVHWKGGVHTQLCAARRRRGEHGAATSKDIVEAIRQLAFVLTDSQIAQVLNRSSLRTAKGRGWNRTRVKDQRRHHGIAVYDAGRQEAEGWLTLREAGTYLSVAPGTVRKAILRGDVAALHPVTRGPWLLRREDLDKPTVRELFEHVRSNRRFPESRPSKKQIPLFSARSGDPAP